MKTFTKWFIIAAATATGSFFAYMQGLFGTIVSNDISYISVLTMLLFAGFTAYAGKIAAAVDKLPANPSAQDRARIEKQLDVGWFSAGHFLNLGLLGTVIGFIYMIAVNVNPQADINATIMTLKVGSGTALYTTLVGLVCSMLLQLQLYVVQYKLKK